MQVNGVRRAAAAHSTLGDGGSEMQGPTAQLKTVDRATTQHSASHLQSAQVVGLRT